MPRSLSRIACRSRLFALSPQVPAPRPPRLPARQVRTMRRTLSRMRFLLSFFVAHRVALVTLSAVFCFAVRGSGAGSGAAQGRRRVWLSRRAMPVRGANRVAGEHRRRQRGDQHHADPLVCHGFAGTAVTLTAHVAAGTTAVTPGILLFCNARLPPARGRRCWRRRFWRN